MAAGGCIRQASDPELPSKILKGVADMSTARDEKLFKIIMLSRMDNTTLYGGDFEIRYTRTKKNVKPTILYQRHDSQIKQFANVIILNLQNHTNATKIACDWVNHLCTYDHLPTLAPDMKATEFNIMLRNFGAMSADSVLTYSDVDAARWEYLSKRESVRVDNVPRPPHSGRHGKHILSKLAQFPVCTITGYPGARKSRDVAPSILGTLLAYYPHQQVGIAMMLDLKEA